MEKKHYFLINAPVHLILLSIGINPENVLKRAGLPLNFFNTLDRRLSVEDYFNFIKAMELEGNDELLAYKIGSAITPEFIGPVLSASLCSKDFKSALLRIKHYKKLIGPMTLDLTIQEDKTVLDFHWIENILDPPEFYILFKLMLFVQIARIGTRKRINPLLIESPINLKYKKEYFDFFGVKFTKGNNIKLVFNTKDTTIPFVTSNEELWLSLEPSLSIQLTNIQNNFSIADEVRAAIIKLLPSGNYSLYSISKLIGISMRTLQRRLKEDKTTYKDILFQTRQNLALHYLEKNFSGSEIAFLLGFENPCSFYRAIQSWTGKTAKQMRHAIKLRELPSEISIY